MVWQSCLVSVFSEDKKGTFVQAGVSCGIETDLTSTHVNGVAVVRIKRSTRERAIAALRRVLDSGKLRPVEAGSLRGQLGYVLGLGKVGKAALKPLVDKEYQSDFPDVVLFPVGRTPGVLTIF